MVAAAKATVASPSHFQAAAPFLLTAFVVLAGGVLSLAVISRVRAEYEDIVREYERSLNDKDCLKRAHIEVTEQDRTVRIRPDYLAEMGTWLIDGGGLFVSLLGPAIGLAILYDRFSGVGVFLYTIVIVLSFVGVFVFVYQVPPSGYPGQPLAEVRIHGYRLRLGRVWILTPVVILVALINFVAGVIILVAGS